MTENTRSRRTQGERTRQRKEQVIRAAIWFFGQNGYHGTRLADIAKAAGVTEPGLLYHFHSKAQLLLEVLAERDRMDRERFDPALREGTQGFLVSLQELAKHNETIPRLVQLFSVLVAESIDEQHPGHGFFKQRYQNLRERSGVVLREAQMRGEIRRDIPAEDLAVMLFAMMDGLQVQWLYEADQVEMARLFEQFIKLLKGNEDLGLDHK